MESQTTSPSFLEKTINFDYEIKDFPCNELCQGDCQKPKCDSSCALPKAFKNNYSCGKWIDTLNSLLHAAVIEISQLRTENAELRQILESKKKVIRIFQQELSNSKPSVFTKLKPTKWKSFSDIDEGSELMKENGRLSSELAVTKGKLGSLTLAWEDSLKRLKSENDSLRESLDQFQSKLEELGRGISTTHLFEATGLVKMDSLTELNKNSSIYPKDAGKDKQDLASCNDKQCPHALQLRRLEGSLAEAEERERIQRDRADDLYISLEAYRMALERQFAESRKFIKQITQSLEAVTPSQGAATSSGSAETEDLSVCRDLVQWIEQALKEAMRENGERWRRTSAPEATSAASPNSSTPPTSPLGSPLRSAGSAPALRTDVQYRKHPVNGRGKSRTMSLRLQTLTKTMDIVKGGFSPTSKEISPLETLLLMVNEILEKLVEGRMEDFIHRERFRMQQIRGTPSNKPVMVTRIC